MLRWGRSLGITTIPGVPHVERLNGEVPILQLKKFRVGQAVSRLMCGESEDSTGVVKANHLQEGRFGSFSNKSPSIFLRNPSDWCYES